MKELILLFVRLGFTAFGGPAAHIGMMEDEVVERRGWMSRQRFLDLISEVGEQVAVIFSTHLVDDVRELCPNMAILHGGRVLMTGRPEDRIESLTGDIWSRSCARAELPKLRQEHQVISTKRRAGKVVLRVHATEAPAGFEPVEPGLEDVYFATLAGVGS